MNATALFESLIKTVAEIGTPEAVGGDVEFISLTLVGDKSEGVQNLGTVRIQADAVNEGGGIMLSPGASYTINAPENSTLKLSQVFIDVAAAGDGVSAFYITPDYNCFNNVENKLELALQKYLQTLNCLLYDVQINTGLSQDEKTERVVYCMVTGGQEEILNTGLWALNTQITVRVRAARDGWQRFHQIVAFIRDLIMDSNLAALLSSMQPNFSVAPRSATNFEIQSSVENNFYIGQISFIIRCNGSNIN